MQPEPRILICRLSALGDCVHTMPLACALKRRWPQSHLTWLTQTSSADLLRGHSAIDRLIELPRGFLKSPARLFELRAELRGQFDLVLDPQSLTKSALPGRLSAAPRRIGFAKPHGREAAPWLNTELVAPQTSHAVDRTLELLRPLGIESPHVEFRLPRSPEADTAIHAWLTVHCGRAPMVMHPGAGWDSKLWSPARYADVARRLQQLHGLPTVVAWAGARVRGWAEEIVAAAPGAAILGPACTLPELIALLRRARLYVGSDSGPLHMAVAAGAPTVSLFGPSRPEYNGPYGAGHCVLQAYFQQGTTRQRKRAHNTAMLAITAAAVAAACDDLLNSLPPAADDRAA